MYPSSAWISPTPASMISSIGHAERLQRRLDNLLLDDDRRVGRQAAEQVRGLRDAASVLVGDTGGGEDGVEIHLSTYSSRRIGDKDLFDCRRGVSVDGGGASADGAACGG